MDSREKAILKTLLYADIFNFPLSEKEIFNYLISDHKVKLEDLREVLKASNLPINSSKKYFFLYGRDNLVQKRIRREKINIKKFRKAKKIIRIIGGIPGVRFIGVSGGLSMQNAEEDDDIDLFVITKNNFLWSTRMFLLMFLNILGVYRNRGSKDLKDKICLNMIIDEERISFKEKKQNLYLAHEIIQLLPVFERDNTYHDFVAANSWVSKFLPNAQLQKNSLFKKKESVYEKLLIYILKFFLIEKITKFVQLIYMKNHITRETVGKKILAFHPFDYEVYILNAYREKTKKFKL